MIDFLNIALTTYNTVANTPPQSSFWNSPFVTIVGFVAAVITIISLLIPNVGTKIVDFLSPRPWRRRYIKNDLSAPSFEEKARSRRERGAYVQPRLTDVAPFMQVEQHWKEKLNTFFIDKVFKKNHGGDKVFCILADTGMGKTTAMVNLFCDYVYRYKAGTLPYEIRLFSFSDSGIFEKINAIDDKQNCILLLDAVDESLEAQNDATYPAFLQKLEATYEQFARVVTTCRPQFFGEGKEEFEVTNARRDSYFVKCKKLYLDYFDEQQVQEYLDQAHTFRSGSPERQKAERIVSRCPDIAMRPLVLSYIDLLVADGKEYRTARDIYDAIVRNLILREVRKRFPASEWDKRERQWLELSSLVAQYMYRHHQLQPTIMQAELDSVVNDYNKGLSEEDRVDAQTFRERSMLTRFGEEYRFSHKSFFEYLMAYRFFCYPWEIDSLQGMDFAVQIFNELVAAWQQDKKGFAIAGQRFSEAYVAASLHQMGYYLQRLNNFKETEKDYKAALEIFRRLADADPVAYEPYVARTLNNLGELHRNMNDFPQAAKEYADALKIYKKLADADPAAYEPDVAMTLNNLGNLHNVMNDYAKAAKEYAESLEIYKRLATADPAAYEPNLATTLNNLGALHYDMHDYAKAAKELAEALKIYKRLAAADPAAYEPKLAATLNNLGNLHRNMNDYPQAAKEHDDALKIHKRLAAANPAAYEPNVAGTMCNIAILLAVQGHFAEAERNAIESRDIYMRDALRDAMRRMMGI